jgi:hypothetical protein
LISPLSTMVTVCLGLPLGLPSASTLVTTSMPSRTVENKDVWGRGGGSRGRAKA